MESTGKQVRPDGHRGKLTSRPTSVGSDRKQFSSFVLFLSAVIILNLCPFHPDPLQETLERSADEHTGLSYLQQQVSLLSRSTNNLGYLKQLEMGARFLRLMFTSPLRLGKRGNRVILADAMMIGKMAKMWYIKKKVKKLGKKLKKHTIAVPVFTAIPIYEHSYYPQPHVTHMGHGGMHHAASSYAPAISPLAYPSASMSAAASAPVAQGQQLAASASNSHQQMAAYRSSQGHPHQQHPSAMYAHPMTAAHQIINSYAPSPPLYVDDAGGLYGHYGNAYGRYDGGYQLW